MRRRFSAVHVFRGYARHCWPRVANTNICLGPSMGSTEMNKLGRGVVVKARLVNLPRLSSVNEVVIFDSFFKDRLVFVSHIFVDILLNSSCRFGRHVGPPLITCQSDASETGIIFPFGSSHDQVNVNLGSSSNNGSRNQIFRFFVW